MMYLRAVWLVGMKENLCTKHLSLNFRSVCRYQEYLSVSHLSSSWGRGEQHIMLSLSDVLSSCAYIEVGGYGGTWAKTNQFRHCNEDKTSDQDPPRQRSLEYLNMQNVFDIQ